MVTDVASCCACRGLVTASTQCLADTLGSVGIALQYVRSPHDAVNESLF